MFCRFLTIATDGCLSPFHQIATDIVRGNYHLADVRRISGYLRSRHVRSSSASDRAGFITRILAPIGNRLGATNWHSQGAGEESANLDCLPSLSGSVG